MRLFCGKCEDVLKELADDSIEAMVTDPPGAIGFMGKKWDSDRGGRDNWITYMAGIFKECLRVLKPGAHGLVWALPRTSHWTATALENAGFEIRNIVHHIFGSGFPKSLNIGKAVDKLQENEREVVGSKLGLPGYSLTNAENQGNTLGWSKSKRDGEKECEITKGNSVWEGWGTDLKPAVETWILVQKPLSSVRLAEIHEITKGDYYHTTSTCYEKSKRFNKYLAMGYEPIIENLEELTERLTAQVEKRLEAGNGELDFETELQKAIDKAQPKKLFRFRTKLALHENVESTWLIEHGKGTSVLKTESFKNLNKKNVAVNALKHGTGGINVDGCRVKIKGDPYKQGFRKNNCNRKEGYENFAKKTGGSSFQGMKAINCTKPNSQGRFPANVILDDSDVVRAGFPETGDNSIRKSVCNRKKGASHFKKGGLKNNTPVYNSGIGSAARFFYCAKQNDFEESRFIYTPKASKRDRDEGLEGFEKKRSSNYGNNGFSSANPTFAIARNYHPTVKSTELMKYLCRLITPKNGTVLDPFMGSGSTGKAAVLEGLDFIGIEQDADYFKIAEARINFVLKKQEKQVKLDI